MHDQELINEFYKTKLSVIDPRLNNAYTISGIDLYKKVTDDEWVLDVGCGPNRYKGKIKNLIGIDPANRLADVHCSIEDFIPDRLYDVAFCLSSINFGTDEIIDNQIKKVVSCLKDKARIYWRLSPETFSRSTKNGVPFMQFYGWTFEKLQMYADKYNFVQSNEQVETSKIIQKIRNKKDHTRLYAEWHRG